MKRTIALVAVLALCAVSSVYALYSVSNTGDWPTTWPKELEPLRKTSRTLVGPTLPSLHYAIPFAKREEFEAAWPHLLAAKTKGAPIVLRRGESYWLGVMQGAGVCVHAPPANSKAPEEPIKGTDNAHTRWMHTTYIELIVDGNIVDLNRIPLPADTPIIDERFEEAAK
jgi:hypothetical protein